MPEFVHTDWPAPGCVKTRVSTRAGGVSRAPWASLNLGDHVGDAPVDVAENRARFAQALPAEPVWLQQIHSARVVELDATRPATPPTADASVCRQAGVVCAVLTADCLPVLFCDRAGSVVAAAHAGWKGLAGGVLEATVMAMRAAPDDILAWLGPAIGPAAFEVGDEVRAAFVASHPAAGAAFVISPGHADKWLADLYALARLRLAAVGVTRVFGGGLCTHTDASRFYSYRREGVTGRMASVVWIADR